MSYTTPTSLQVCHLAVCDWIDWFLRNLQTLSSNGDESPRDKEADRVKRHGGDAGLAECRGAGRFRAWVTRGLSNSHRRSSLRQYNVKHVSNIVED
jgi:hypothetical protein